MAKTVCTVPITQIILDEDIYPREGVSPKRVSMFAENMRDGFEIELDLNIFHMRRLGIPQERIALCLGVPQQTISNHLPKMAVLPNPVNTELKQGFTVPQVAEKHGWAEPLVWSIALEGKSDLDRFKALKWGLRTWDLWNWNDCDTGNPYFSGATLLRAF